jgi:hypothetical protein
LQPLAGSLHFPNLNICTSCRHYVHFQTWTFVLPSTWFIIFLALDMKVVLSET